MELPRDQARSESAQLVSAVYVSCLVPLNHVLYCNRFREPTDPQCADVWDAVWQCVARTTCPASYARARDCVLGQGAAACAAAPDQPLAALERCADRFWALGARPAVAAALRPLADADTACARYRRELRRCERSAADSARDPGRSSNPCAEERRRSQDCFAHAVVPKELAALDACRKRVLPAGVADSATECVAEREQLARAVYARGRPVLQAMDFAEPETQGPRGEAYQKMVYAVFAGSAVGWGDGGPDEERPG